MTWEETNTNFEFNFVGIVSVIATFIIGLLNGTLLHIFPSLNLPEMNIHDWITITISILSGIFIIVKIANGVLSFISKKRHMKEEQELREKFNKRIEKRDIESPEK